MADQRNIDVLNRMFVLVYRSLPTYLAGVSPWIKRGEERALTTLSHIVSDQQDMATQIADLINRRGGQTAGSGYPMEFTDLNMLSLDFLLREAIEWERNTIAEIESSVAQLRNDVEGRRLAEELLGLEKGHLENLEETVKELV